LARVADQRRRQEIQGSTSKRSGVLDRYKDRDKLAVYLKQLRLGVSGENVSKDQVTEDQEEAIPHEQRATNQGCGLVMVGGPRRLRRRRLAEHRDRKKAAAGGRGTSSRSKVQGQGAAWLLIMHALGDWPTANFLAEEDRQAPPIERLGPGRRGRRPSTFGFSGQVG